MREKRYKINESNLLLVDTKIEIINILEMVMDYQNDLRLTQFLTAFHRDMELIPLTEAQINFINKVNGTN